MRDSIMVMAEDVVNPISGEVLLQAYSFATYEMFEVLYKVHGIEKFRVLEPGKIMEVDLYNQSYKALVDIWA